MSAFILSKIILTKKNKRVNHFNVLNRMRHLILRKRNKKEIPINLCSIFSIEIFA